MANTIVQFHSLASLGALTLKLYPRTGGAIVNGASGDAMTESGATAGLYTATVAEALTGIYAARVYSGSDLLGSFLVRLRDDTGAYDLADPAIGSGAPLNVVPSVTGVGEVCGDMIIAYQDAAGEATIAAVDSDGEAVVLPADLTFCVEWRDAPDKPTDVFTMTPTPSGNEALVTWTAADLPSDTIKPSDYLYSLRDTSDGRVYAEGVFRVKRAALAD